MSLGTTPAAPAGRRSLLNKVWPAALGLLVALGTVYGVSDGRDVRAVVAASGLVYLAAAATGRRGAAWPAFGLTFVLIALGILTALDAAAVIVGVAALAVVTGFARTGAHPFWAMPLQTAAMLVLATVALLVVHADATVGGLVVAASLLCHAAWDVHHHRTGRVVSPSLAEFCAVLDVVLGVAVGVIALSP